MTTSSPHPLEELVDEVLRTSGRLVAGSSGSASSGSGADALSGAQRIVLSAVVRAERPPTVSQIARSLGHSRQAVQRLADALADRGYVAFVDNPDHKRARRLVGTEAGRRSHDDADLQSRDWAARVTAGVSADQIAATTATLRTIRHAIEVDVAARSA